MWCLKLEGRSGQSGRPKWNLLDANQKVVEPKDPTMKNKTRSQSQKRSPLGQKGRLKKLVARRAFPLCLASKKRVLLSCEAR